MMLLPQRNSNSQWITLRFIVQPPSLHHCITRLMENISPFRAITKYSSTMPMGVAWRLVWSECLNALKPLGFLRTRAKSL